jgi:hypothetical protein
VVPKPFHSTLRLLCVTNTDTDNEGVRVCVGWLVGGGRTLQLDELSKELAEFHALDSPVVNFAATSRSTTGMSTPAPRLTLLHDHLLHRISSEASIVGRERIFDSPEALQGPLPTIAGPSGSGAVQLVQPDAEVP